MAASGTRLSAHLLADFRDGVWFVDLAPLTDPELVLPTSTRVLGIQDAARRPLLDTVRAALADKGLLLVLDNFERMALLRCWSAVCSRLAAT